MDMYTKVFLINIVLATSYVLFDLFKNDKNKTVSGIQTPLLILFWVITSVLSIPLWLILLIVKA